MSAMLSRRRMMKLGAGTLLALGLWPGRMYAADTDAKPLKFIVVNDFHYAEDACTPFFEALVKEFNKVQDASLALIVGDLIDGGTLAQAQAIRAILKNLKMPYYVTAGNHDSATQTDRAGFDAVFGNKLNVTFETSGWQFVGMDTSDGIKVKGFDCHKETLDFAAGLPGKLDQSKPTFVYTHFPLGPEVTNRLQNADAVLEPFKQLNVSAIFNGHYHAFTERKVLLNQTIVTTDRCCSRKRANHDGTLEKGFFVIEAAEGKHKRMFVEFGSDWPGGARPPEAATRAATQPR